MTLSDTHQTHRWHPPDFKPPPPQEPPDLEAMADAARQKGYSDGYQEGLAAAEKKVEQIASLAQQLVKPYQHLGTVLIRELTALTITLTTQVIQRELTTDSSTIENSLTQAFSALSQLEGAVSIHVHPVDKLLVEELAPQLLEEEQKWRITEDDSLIPGGCRIETPQSFVDASIEQRMQTLFSSLLDTAEDSTDNNSAHDSPAGSSP